MFDRRFRIHQLHFLGTISRWSLVHMTGMTSGATSFVLEIFPSRAMLSVFVILKRECSLKRFVCQQLHWYSGACIVKFSERTQQHAWHIVRGRATLRGRELPCLYVFSMCVHVYVHGVRKHGGREHFAKVYQRFRGTHFNRKRLHFPEQRPE